MEHISPKAICCGVPIVWVRYAFWEDEVCEGMCVWCRREFAYFDGPAPQSRGNLGRRR